MINNKNVSFTVNSIIKNFSDWNRLFEADAAQPAAQQAGAPTQTAAQPTTKPAAAPAGAAPAAGGGGGNAVMLIQARTDVTPHTPELAAKLGGALNTRYQIESKSGSFLKDLVAMSKAPDGSNLQDFVKMTPLGAVPASTDELTIGSKSVNGVKASGQFTVLAAEFVGPITASGNGLLAFSRVATSMRRAADIAKSVGRTVDLESASQYAISFILGAKSDSDDARGVKCTHLSLSETGNSLFTMVSNSILDRSMIGLLNLGKVKNDAGQEFKTNAFMQETKTDQVWSNMLSMVTKAGNDPIPAITDRAAKTLRTYGVLVNSTPDTSAASAAFNDLISKSADLIIHPKGKTGKTAAESLVEPDRQTELQLTVAGTEAVKQVVLKVINSIKPVSLPEGFDASAQPVMAAYADFLEKILTAVVSRKDLPATEFIKIQNKQNWQPAQIKAETSVIASENLPSGAF